MKEAPGQVHSCKFYNISKKALFVEHVQMAAFRFWTRSLSISDNSSKNYFNKISSKTAKKEIFCHHVITILNVFVTSWLKCTRWNNVYFNSISTSENCYQKKKFCFENSLLCYFRWVTEERDLKSFIWCMEANMKSWVVHMLSW